MMSLLNYSRVFFFLLSLFLSLQANAFQSSHHSQYDTLSKKSQEAYYSGDLKLYKKYIDSTIYYSQKHQLKDQYVLSLMNKGIYHKNVGELDSTITTYLSILKEVKLYPDTSKTKILVEMNLANAYLDLELKEKARPLLKKVIKNASVYPDADRVLTAANNALGSIYLKEKNYNNAKEYLLKAKRIAHKNSKGQIVAAINNNLFDIHYDKGEYQDALGIADDAISLHQLDSSETKTSSYYNKGIALLKLGQTKEAIEYLDKAGQIASNKNFYELAMLTSKMLAEAYEISNDYQKSLEAQKEYLERKEKYLSTLSEAKRIEIKQELAEQEALNSKQEQELSIYKGKLFKTILVVFVLLVILIFLMLYYRSRKKRMYSDHSILQRDKEILKFENEELKNKLENLSVTISENSNHHQEFKYKKPSVSEKDRKFYIKQILEYMDEEKPYLDYDIKQSDIARKLGITVHQFSEILNTSLENNFNNFINLYRVNEAKKLMKNPDYEDYKIMAIGFEAGFKSKTSFNRAFKNLVGLTPSEYREQSA